MQFHQGVACLLDEPRVSRDEGTPGAPKEACLEQCPQPSPLPCPHKAGSLFGRADPVEEGMVSRLA